jgi:hypothetical protein
MFCRSFFLFMKNYYWVFVICSTNNILRILSLFQLDQFKLTTPGLPFATDLEAGGGGLQEAAGYIHSTTRLQLPAARQCPDQLTGLNATWSDIT